MYLIIDNSLPESLALFCYTDGLWEEQVFENSAPGSLLVAIDKVLRAKKMSLQDLQGLGVVVGKGRFTATRVAVTTANTLAFALGIPVVAIDDMRSDLALDRITSVPVGQLVSATYSAEARIGGK